MHVFSQEKGREQGGCGGGVVGGERRGGEGLITFSSFITKFPMTTLSFF